AFDGIVRYAQYNKSGFGNCVIIRHMNGLETVYAHLSKIDVQPNAFVTSGQSIGLGGNTGHSKGPHLHFETRYKDFSFDPELYIDVKNQTLKLDTLILKPESFTAYRYLADRKQKANENTDSIQTDNNSVPVAVTTPNTAAVIPDATTNTTSTPPTLTSKPNPQTNTSAPENPTNNPSKPTSVTTAAKPTTNPTPANKPAANTNTLKKPINTKKSTNSQATTAKPATPKAKSATASNKTSKTATPKVSPTTTKKNLPAAKKTPTNQPKTGQKTKTTAPKKSGKSYTITAGDNLTVISKKTGIPIQKIRKLNIIKADNKLMPGQTLRLN
ncbi:MAG: peptidoglycan DD-metalloendopeptidase family protein, partial [Ferruginibacter sp.]